jgi:hypothetical protein
LLEVGQPVSVNGVSSSDKLARPYGQLLVRYITTAEQLVALFNAALETLPFAEKMMFHVEHTPIKKSPPGPRRARQQLKTISVDNLEGQVLDQLGNSAHSRARHLYLYFSAAPSLHTKIRVRPGSRCHRAENRTFLFLMVNQGTNAAASKRARHTQQVHGFQQACFARPVGTTENIHARQGRNSRLLQVSHVVYMKSGQGHRRLSVGHCRYADVCIALFKGASA